MTDTIPEFDADGLLPPGDYEVTLVISRDSVAASVTSLATNWNFQQRFVVLAETGARVAS